jgi:hypothetical protein
MPKHDYNLLQCNPSTLKKTHTTCLPHEMLIRLRDAWNVRFPKHAISVAIRKKEDLWAALKAHMQNQYNCASEYCTVKQLGNDNDKTAAKGYFRPEKPVGWAAKPDDWHDSISIQQVLQQYEDAFPHFQFIGTVPIDFDAKLPGAWGTCVVDELCSLDLSKMKAKGCKAIGIVFNLDPHDKPGSHWVCGYIDLVSMKAYYYDSYGYEPCAEIKRLLRRCKEQGCTEIIWNDICHQKKKSECGTYCMYIIISLLKGKTFSWLCKNRVDDDTMNAFRDILYATERPSAVAIRDVVKLLEL